jgi:CBS domain containing-hemolysin-like protein
MNDVINLAILLLLSGIFSASETAMVTLSLARADSLLKEGRAGAAALVMLKRNPSRMLTTILIGNNLVNIAASALATVMATSYFGNELGPGIAVGAITLLILVFGEVTPKNIATRYAERLSLLFAPFINFLGKIFFPLVWLFEQLTQSIHNWTGAEPDPTITHKELIQLAGHGEVEGTIEKDEREMIERIFSFSELKAEDVMTPRGDVFMLDGNLPLNSVLTQIIDEAYSRIPLYENDSREITKVLQFREILIALAQNKADAKLSSLAFDPVFCPGNQPVDELLARLRQHKQHLTVVVDEHGAMIGVVTLEDLLEEVVGEIYDETDDLPDEYMLLADNKILVEGSAELRVVENFFGIDLPGKPTDTLNLWILEHVERIPKEDERFELDGLSVLIQSASSSRIDKIIIERPIQTDPD